jgi:cellulose synthase (UDP-forming)
VLVIALMLIYLPWLFEHLNTGLPWLSWPVAAASALSALCLALSVINGWCSRVTPPRPLAGPDVPEVAVIIPTWGEPVPMVLRTVRSVLEQDYPRAHMHVVVSDDAHNRELEGALADLDVSYHDPPPRDAPGRDGAAKAGNLNSALAFVRMHFPRVSYIETRDADDELGSNRFLRQTIGQLECDAQLAFVQTVKESQVAGIPDHP